MPIITTKELEAIETTSPRTVSTNDLIDSDPVFGYYLEQPSTSELVRPVITGEKNIEDVLEDTDRRNAAKRYFSEEADPQAARDRLTLTLHFADRMNKPFNEVEARLDELVSQYNNSDTLAYKLEKGLPVDDDDIPFTTPPANDKTGRAKYYRQALERVKQIAYPGAQEGPTTTQFAAAMTTDPAFKKQWEESQKVKRDFFEKTIESYRRGGQAIDTDVAVWQAVMNGGDIQQALEIKKKLETQQALDPIEGNFFSKLVYGAAGSVAPSAARGFMEAIPEAATAAVTGAGFAAAAGQAGPQLLAPEEVFTVPGAALAGLGVGATAGSFEFWWRQGAGAFYASALENGANSETAANIAGIAAIPYAAIEFAQISSLTPGIRTGMQQIVQKSVAKVLAKASLKYGTTLAENVAQEVAQEVINISSDDLSAYLGKNGIEISPEYFKERASRVWESAKGAAQSFALAPIPGAAVDTVTGVRNLTSPQESFNLSVEKDLTGLQGQTPPTPTQVPPKDFAPVLDAANARLEDLAAKGDLTTDEFIEQAYLEQTKNPAELAAAGYGQSDVKMASLEETPDFETQARLELEDAAPAELDIEAIQEDAPELADPPAIKVSTNASRLYLQMTNQESANGKPVTVDAAGNPAALELVEAGYAKFTKGNKITLTLKEDTQPKVLHKWVSEESYQAALKKMRETKLYSGIPADKLAAAVKIGVYHFEGGARTFAQWSGKMIEELGDRVRPELRMLWDRITAPKVIDQGELQKRIERMQATLGGRKVSVTTGIPTDWQGIPALYDNGNAIRAAEEVQNEEGEKTKEFSDSYRKNLTRIEVGTQKLLKAVKERTGEVWPVKTKQGKFWVTEYYLAPTKIVDEIKTQLSPEDLKPKRKLDQYTGGEVVWDENGIPDFMPELREQPKAKPKATEAPKVTLDEAIDEIIGQVERMAEQKANDAIARKELQFFDIKFKLEAEHAKAVEKQNKDYARDLKAQIKKFEDLKARIKNKGKGPKTAKQVVRAATIPGTSIKSAIRRNTGIVKIGDVIREDLALQAALKKAQTAAATGYRAGEQAGIEQQKQRQQEIEERAKAVKAIRERIQNLANIIKKPASDNVDFYYREAIEIIQDSIDPAFRSVRTREQRARTRAFLANHPDKLNDMPKKLLEKLNKKTLGEFTLDELESMAREVQRLKKQGKLKRQIVLAQEKRELDTAKSTMLNSILRGRKLVKPEGPIVASTRKENIAQRAAIAARAFTLRPARLFDMLDGGKGTFRGIVHKWFNNKVNAAHDETLNQTRTRKEQATAKLKELGLSWTDLGKTRVINGTEFTVDELIGIYCASQNQSARAAMEYGNQIDDATARLAIQSLTPEEKAWGTHIIEDYQKRYAALRESVIEVENRDMGYEENYTPIRRTNLDYQTTDKEIIREILEKEHYRKARINKGFAIERIEVPAEYQKPFNLNVSAVWLEQIHRQERYIAAAKLLKQLRNIAEDKDIRAGIEQEHGKDYITAIDHYLDRVTNPNIYKSFGLWNSVSRGLRANASIAYLAFNLVTIVKQLPAVLYYLPDAGPMNLSASLAEFAANPLKLIKKVSDLDPQIKELSVQREIEEMKQAGGSTFNKVRAKIGLTGMYPIVLLDKIARVVGWNAVYQKALAEGLSELEAIQEAQNATLRTQSAAASKDIPEIYATNEGLNWLTMFTNQLNQIYNIATYDIFAQWGNGQYQKAGLAAAGLALAAVVEWSISNRRPPEEPEDFAQIASNQALGAMPLVGGALSAGLEGWGAPEIIGLKPFVAAGKALNPDMSDGAKINAILEATALSVGLPYTQPKRVKKFMDTGNPMELIGGNPRR
jgi:hypothetical protein